MGRAIGPTPICRATATAPSINASFTNDAAGEWLAKTVNRVTSYTARASRRSPRTWSRIRSGSGRPALGTASATGTITNDDADLPPRNTWGDICTTRDGLADGISFGLTTHLWTVKGSATGATMTICAALAFVGLAAPSRALAQTPTLASTSDWRRFPTVAPDVVSRWRPAPRARPS
jgi:hypothetical protein